VWQLQLKTVTRASRPSPVLVVVSSMVSGTTIVGGLSGIAVFYLLALQSAKIRSFAEFRQALLSFAKL
jgi:hypothetical protein